MPRYIRVTDSTTMGSTGTSSYWPIVVVATAAIASTTSMPSMTPPKVTDRQGALAEVRAAG